MADNPHKFMELINTGPIIIYCLEVAGNYRCTYITDNIKRELGYEVSEMLTNPYLWQEQVHPDDRQRICDDLPNLLAEGSRTYEYRFRHRNGCYRWMRDEIRVARDGLGRPIELVGYWIDITEQKRAEHLLRAINEVFSQTLACESEEEVALVCLRVAEQLTNSQFGFISQLNNHGNNDVIAVSNPGWTTCDMPNTQRRQLLKDMEIRSYWGRAIRQGQTQIVNHPETDTDRIGLPAGHPPITRFMGVPLHRDHQTIGLIALANKCCDYQDADREAVEELSLAFVEALCRKRSGQEIVELNRQLAQHVKDLESANSELDAFCYSVSHDLRAPLRHITGFAELLIKHATAQLDSQGKHYLEVISGAAKKMGMLVDDLLSFSRMGRSLLKKSHVDLSWMIADIQVEMQLELKGRNVVWEIAALPEVEGDATMLRVALVNLLSNALKFTKTRPQAIIEIGCRRSPAEIVFFVRDNGVGFDMLYVDKLFGVFQRLHRQEEFEGTGIGLANVRRIIARHGGKTWAEGVVNGGATIYFSLPNFLEKKG